MSEQFEAWASFEAKGELKEWKYTPRPLGELDVEIAISHCGICYSDIHTIDSGWGPTNYPVVPGHEIVGHVVKVGSGVSEFKVGDRVGVGAQCCSCCKKQCDYCTGDLEQYCSRKVFTYGSKFEDGEISRGGYAKKVRVHERFTFKIPDNIPGEEIAPLLCAGVTTYEPLVRFKVGAGHKLGVIGIGGLGHLGIQWGAALGSEVTAISRSDRKKDLAFKLGAKHFLSSADQSQMVKEAASSFDFLLMTENVTFELSHYLKLLKPAGAIILVALPEAKIQFSPFDLLSSGRSIHTSLIGSPARIKEMLKLAEEKNIRAMAQVFPISQVNEAIAGVREGKPTFRYVLKISEDK
eukprot:TRINITY_DN3351_c0_g1_i1.p1 TRINITY_DN3351_c0_g1~~TRINITY_DN3351_c0_g1_i1.p1  ORF type:complete len:361 (+),score=33.03 TRINITY_DN3351_c0_g1_i1:32-1084(+)